MVLVVVVIKDDIKAILRDGRVSKERLELDIID